MPKFQAPCVMCKRIITVDSKIAVNAQVITKADDPVTMPDGFIMFNKAEQACPKCGQLLIGILNGGVFAGFTTSTMAVQEDTGAMWSGESYIPVAIFNHLVMKVARLSGALKDQATDDVETSDPH